jgi:hypothetical protein
MNNSPFETVNISLPVELMKFLRDAAFREDRTISGQVRHLVVKAARQAPPPPAQQAKGARDGPVLEIKQPDP